MLREDRRLLARRSLGALLPGPCPHQVTCSGGSWGEGRRAALARGLPHHRPFPNLHSHPFHLQSTATER